MDMRRMTAIAAIALGLGLAAGSRDAGAQTAIQQGRTQVGTLACNVQGSVGLVLGSVKTMTCTLDPAGGGPNELYVGQVRRVGVDIGITGNQVIAWAVFAPTVNFAPGALAGTYAGASAESTAGFGLGANVLVGGSNDTVMLQPVSVSAQTGVNVAAGIAGLTLRPAGAVR